MRASFVEKIVSEPWLKKALKTDVWRWKMGEENQGQQNTTHIKEKENCCFAEIK
jgi:hypothetical protein